MSEYPRGRPGVAQTAQQACATGNPSFQKRVGHGMSACLSVNKAWPQSCEGVSVTHLLDSEYVLNGQMGDNMEQNVVWQTR